MFSGYNIHFFCFLIKIILLIEIISIRSYCSMNLNSSYIIIKIQGGGNKNIFCPTYSFHEENRPDSIKVDNQIKTTVTANQYLNWGTHTVILEWTRDREDYSHIFHGCSDIIEIDLSNFKTSQVKYMGSMFRECSSLTSIRFTDFDSTSAVDMGAMFYGCKQLTSIDLFWFDTSKVTYMWNMFAECSSLTSLDLSSFDTRKVGYMWGMFSDCTSLTSLDLSSFDTSLVSEMGELFKNCINLEYIDMINFKEDYLDHAGNMFESVPNNVVVCINSNILNKILTALETRQCYTVDCTDNWKLRQKKIIKDTGQCITDCEDSNQYIYEYNNMCYSECPTGTKSDGNNKCKCAFDKCLDCPGEAYTKNLCTKCNNDYYPKEGDSRNTVKFFDCYKEPIGFYLDKAHSIFRACYFTCETCEEKGNDINHKCIICKPNKICLPIRYTLADILKEINSIPKDEEELIEYYEQILETVEKYFSFEIYDTSNIDKGNEDIIPIDKMHITLTTSENQRNNINDFNYTTINTLIDLAQCEMSLRAFHNISNVTSIYIQKIEVVQEGFQIPKVEYKVYSRNREEKLQKLNLSVCEKDKINIYTNIESISNLDIIYPSSDYYNDICYPTTSDFGTDITLSDRKNEFVEKNRTVCQDDCTLIGYNYITKKANCSCDVKEPSLSYEKIGINKTKLFQNFLDVNFIANFDFLLCYKILFKKNALLKNIGSYILIWIIFFHIISIFIFYIKSFPKIKNIINNFYFCKNLNTTKGNKTDRNKEQNNIITSSLKNNPKNHINKKLLIKYKKRKKKKVKNIIRDKINHSKKIKKNKIPSNILKYTDDEINDLEYETALKKDKRNYCKYYISLIKTKHDIYFSFFYGQDYNAKILKIDLFFLGFAMSYIINGLFFTDDTMHKIYEDEGSFDYLYQLPKTIYSTVISFIVDYIIKYLALSNDAILDFKNIESTKNLKKEKKNLIKKLKTKFVIYFILSSMLLLLFWYYIAMFGEIYQNTQIHLIKDTIFSFGESFLYPFWINLLPGIFRIPALSNKKNKRLYLYKMSQILQKL